MGKPGYFGYLKLALCTIIAEHFCCTFYSVFLLVERKQRNDFNKWSGWMYHQQFSYQIILNTSQLMKVVDGTLIAFVLHEGIKGFFLNFYCSFRLF